MTQPDEHSGIAQPDEELADSVRGHNGSGAASAPDPTPAGASAPDLTPTGRVILGMIALGKRTGYEIKQLVDRSTRHFWAASYGQIYPELRRLKAEGLVAGRSEPSGGRARTVYELTAAGERALQQWLGSDQEPVYEVRDEAMLKLFFSDLTAPERRIENIRAMRAVQEHKRDQLRMLAAKADQMPSGPRTTLELGTGLNAWMIDWCEATERRMSAEIESNGEGAIEAGGGA